MLNRQSETAVLTISDIHYGKQTSTYNPKVFVKRLDKLLEKLIRIKEEHLSSYDFDKLVVCILGDINDGNNIYPGQATEQAITNVEQQADEISRLLSNFLTELKKVWGEVEVECVPGNHGRGGQGAHTAANWDITCYRYLKYRLEKENIQVNFNEAKDGLPVFIRQVKIRKHQFLLYHGHAIRSYASIPWYGLANRTMRWQSTDALGRADVYLMGHFHTGGFWPINNYELFLSGTMVTDDEWALQTLGWESSDHWWLIGVSDKYCSTWKFDLRVAH